MTERGAPLAAEGVRQTKGGLSPAEVFDAFPYGIIVVDESGFVLSCNDAAKRLLGLSADDPAAAGMTCCDLFGCLEPDGALGHACITDAALTTRGPVPEIRVDLPGTPSGAAWITAGRVEGEARHVIYQVRPGRAEDRRRRTEPHWTTGPLLHVRALGATEVDSPEGPIGGQWLEQRAGQLLKFLICERHRVVPLDEIADVFWREAGRSGPNNVRHFIHALRDRLQPCRTERGESAFIVTREGGYALNLRRIDLDVEHFEQLAAAGFAREEGDGRRERDLEEAARLYQGDLVAEEYYAEWAMPERDRLRGLARRALWVLATTRLVRGDCDGAQARLERIIEIEPFETAAHRALIALCLDVGNLSEAHRRYASLRARMRANFGMDPDFDLAQLRQRRGGAAAAFPLP